MKFFKKPIFIGFMPNLLRRDIFYALTFFLPWNWRFWQKGSGILLLDHLLKQYFEVKSITFFDSGRSSLLMALRSLSIHPGDEVLLQAYTCGVVSNAILWSGATPIYVDVNDKFTLDIHDLKKKITPRSKVLIIQHTFGIPADLEILLSFAKEHNLLVIEDCAHVMGASYKGKLLGTFGDIGMFSYGTEKPASAVRGGFLVTDNNFLGQTLERLQKNLPLVPHKIIFQHIVTLIVFFLFKPLYNLGIGKIVLGFLKKANVLSRIINEHEKRGEKPLLYPAQFPNVLARIALHQTLYISLFNQKRKKISELYRQQIKNKNVTIPEVDTDTILLRFPLLVNNPKKLLTLAQKEGIYLGDWYSTPIAPSGYTIEKIGYTIGSCPNAEFLSKQSVNLPTSYHISEDDVKRIVKIVNSYAE